MKKLIFLLLLLFPAQVFAIAYTSTGTGNWNAAATWGGAGVPGAGDSATVSVGDIVRIIQNETVGTGAGIGVFDLDIAV